MIYAYFDRNRVLKELINDTTNSGDKNVNVIAIYWEDDDASYECGIRYQKADKSLYPASFDDMTYSSSRSREKIDFIRGQDLKFFSYDEYYYFRKFTIPDEVLSNTTDNPLPVLASVYFLGSNDRIWVLDRFAFNVGPSTSGVAMDEHINLAEWNTLLNVIFNKQLFIVGSQTDIDVENSRVWDMFFIVDTQQFMYINESHTLALWDYGFTFDNIPTAESNNAVKSGGIYSWVLTQISNLGTLKAHICTSAADTPYGVTWGNPAVTGTLTANDAATNYPATIFLVPSDDEYTEYYYLESSEDTYTWAIFGTTSIGLPDAPSVNGKYDLLLSVASNTPTYSWVSQSDYVISTDGTQFDLNDLKYKLYYNDEYYYPMSYGVYGCISSANTVKVITVDPSRFTWSVSTQAVTAINSSSFSIGSTTYTLPAIAVVPVVDGGTADYDLLEAHPDYLLSNNGSIYHFIGIDSSDRLCYSTLPLSAFSSGTPALTLTLITIADVTGAVSITSNSFNKVVASPLTTGFLEKIMIGGVVYTINETLDLGSSSSGTLTATQLTKLENNVLIIKCNNEYFHLVEDDGTYYTFASKNSKITVTKSSRAWSYESTKLYRYLITLTITPSGNSQQQDITFECITHANISNKTEVSTKLSGQEYACGEVYYPNLYQLGLIRSLTLNYYEGSGDIVYITYYPINIIGSSPSSITFQSSATNSYAIDDISYIKEEL